ncbi:ATP/GTP-binding protein [Demequina pelophila]|uniref:ATP/GTP-binding protein n=1 Tax=Demequina pelophila TaxID=1638984 RepID=UPI000782721A|nr:ATP/GTP-binding protein [Demequina pelophila]
MIEILGERARALAASGRVLVGVAGPPGSGKSTLARELAAHLVATGTPAVVVPMDGFHLGPDDLAEQGLADVKGAPETFDREGLARLLGDIREARRSAVRAPEYDRELHAVVPRRIAVPPQIRVVIAEGNYLGIPGWEDVRRHLDELWHLDVPWAVCRERLVARRVATGREADAAVAWVDRVDAANARLVAAALDSADVVVDGASLVREGEGTSAGPGH